MLPGRRIAALLSAAVAGAKAGTVTRTAAAISPRQWRLSVLAIIELPFLFHTSPMVDEPSWRGAKPCKQYPGGIAAISVQTRCQRRDQCQWARTIAAIGASPGL